MFQKGKSGNPKGRPKKGKTFSDIIENELSRVKQEVKENGREREVNGKTMLVLSLIKMALTDGDSRVRLQATEKLMERLEGKPMQQMVVEADVENHSVFDEIDVSKLSTAQKQNLEDILKSMQ